MLNPRQLNCLRTRYALHTRSLLHLPSAGENQHACKTRCNRVRARKHTVLYSSTAFSHRRAPNQAFHGSRHRQQRYRRARTSKHTLRSRGRVLIAVLRLGLLRLDGEAVDRVGQGVRSEVVHTHPGTKTQTNAKKKKDGVMPEYAILKTYSRSTNRRGTAVVRFNNISTVRNITQRQEYVYDLRLKEAVGCVGVSVRGGGGVGEPAT